MTAFEPDVSMWDPWPPELVAALLAGVRVPWYVAAGWAIELFLGGGHREHEDLEIAVPNARFAEVEPALVGFEVFVITNPNEATPLAAARGQEKNRRDFEATLPRLDGGRRRWLRDALERVHPGHAWLDELARAA